ncbi:MAG: AAA family ATPase, partial [Acidobacteria bacterium]|nr:AAA family ATPase [Acidobacteriota bacterium]
MDDLDVKRPLVDDPGFLDRLNDLDRGLHAGAPPPRQRSPDTAAVDTPTQAAPVHPPAPATLPRSITSDQPRHRPLLDLFPPTALTVERPPGPMPGIAVGPRPPDVQPGDLKASPASASPALDLVETFSGQHDTPFGTSTDLKFFFPSAEHERATASVLTAIRDRDGVTLLTGDLGVGTTTLCRALVGRLDRHTVWSQVLRPLDSFESLLRTMLVDFGVVGRHTIAAAPAPPRDILVATLRSFIDSLTALRASAVVIVDDAQQQPAAMLESLAELIGRGDGESGLLVVLAGQPQLKARLADRPRLRGLDAAIRSRVELGPLTGEEMAGYVAHRLAVAGPAERVRFDQRALDRIFELSRGVPGVVNLLCDRALTVAAGRSATTIDASMVAVAAPETVADAPPPSAHSTANIVTVAALLAVLTFAGASVALWMFRDDAARAFEKWQDLPA